MKLCLFCPSWIKEHSSFRHWADTEYLLLTKLKFCGTIPLFVVFREEIARQRNAARQRKLQEEGKTDQARADLARLAVIKKQREEAAKKREEQKKGNANDWQGGSFAFILLDK